MAMNLKPPSRFREILNGRGLGFRRFVARWSTPQAERRRSPLGISRRGIITALFVGALGAPRTAHATINRVLMGGASASPYPASIVSTGLQAIYDLRLGGAGPRTTPTKTIAGNMAELTALGATSGADWIEFQSGCTITGFDFTGSNKHHWIWGSGDVTYVDCKFDFGSRLAVGSGHGSATKPTSTAKAIYSYCDFDAATTFIFYGGATANYCRFRNGGANYWQTYGTTTANVDLAWDHCYVTGGGYNLASGTHVELIQHGSHGSLSCTNTLIDITDQVRIDPAASGPGTGWTAILSSTLSGATSNLTTTISNSIFLGLVASNAKFPNKVAYDLAYSEAVGKGVTLTNNVMETGAFGYCGNGNGGRTRPTNGGNNRDFFSNARLSPL